MKKIKKIGRIKHPSQNYHTRKFSYLKLVTYFLVFAKVVYCTIKCSSGNFNEYDQCFKCHVSCSECEQYGQCTSCKEGFSYNATSKLCDYQDCPDGEFYSIDAMACSPCGDSCNSLCAYQSHCFECPVGEFLNLDDMFCVSECDLTTQVAITDSQLKDIPVCRSFDYYVNSNSRSLTELGTKLHPYKDLESVFVEIVNFHSNNERNLTVFVMEGTTAYANSPTYISNVTHVQIESYTEDIISPGIARLVGVTNSSKIVESNFSTKFTILANHSKLLNEQIFDREGFNSDERKDLLLNNAVFRPFHAGLIIHNFRIRTDYDDPATLHALIDPISVDTKVVGLKDCDVKIQGTLFRAVTQAMNFYLENIKVETQFLHRLTLITFSCAPDGTDLGTKLYWKNVTIANSGPKPSYLHLVVSLMRNTLANNMHMEDCTFDTYEGYSNGKSPFVFNINPNECIPVNDYSL